ncbi:hypothetical protein UlMin_002634 [Ulmus minor]
MGEADNCSVVKRTLKSLCVSNGWSYGIFWRFDQRNPILLSMEDAYYEERVGAVIDDMLLQLHILGEGTIGQTALNGKHQWILADGSSGEWNSFRSVENKDTFHANSENYYQFSSGIKTIAVISVEPCGVVQFGSTEKIYERLEFVAQTKRLFHEMENEHSSLKGEMYDVNELFASLISSGTFNVEKAVPLSCGNYKELRGDNCSAMNSNDSSPSTSDVHSGKMATSNMDTFFLASECPDLPSFDAPNIQGDSSFSSFGAVSLADIERFLQGNLMDNQQVGPSAFASQSELSEKAVSLDRYSEELLDEVKLSDFATDLFNCYQLDDLSQLLASSPDQSINQMANALNNDLTQLIESTSTSSCLIGGDAFVDKAIECPANSLQSSITNALGAEKQDKSVLVQNDGKIPFDGQKVGVECGQVKQCWEDSIMSLVTGNYPTTSSASSKCISGMNSTSMAGPKKGLFSELGLEELLVGSSSSVTKSSLEDQSLPAKRRRMESSSMVGSNGSMSLLQYNLDKTNNLVIKKELPKSRVGLWIDDSYSITAGSNVLAQAQKPEEHKKATRKRARPGESTRPRPKDRQLIQDRIKELRGIIPNGGKCSIDSLLDRTIKYMLFLQGVTKYADKLTHTSEPKLLDKENGVVLRDKAISSGGNTGVTWAFEVGSQTMVCPIIVEDLSTPGQMLIEMLCEEQGFFLEIADIIRGFGLSILKGVMEVREKKIWARFIVEAQSHVTRIDIFWSLVRLLQQADTNGMDSTNQPVMDVGIGIPLMESYQKPTLPPPICLTETLG